jgi:hypothetical protein
MGIAMTANSTNDWPLSSRRRRGLLDDGWFRFIPGFVLGNGIMGISCESSDRIGPSGYLDW